MPYDANVSEARGQLAEAELILQDEKISDFRRDHKHSPIIGELDAILKAVRDADKALANFQCPAAEAVSEAEKATPVAGKRCPQCGGPIHHWNWKDETFDMTDEGCAICDYNGPGEDGEPTRAAV